MKRLMKIEIQIGDHHSIFTQSRAVRRLLRDIAAFIEDENHIRDGQTGRLESAQWTAVSATWSVEAPGETAADAAAAHDLLAAAEAVRQFYQDHFDAMPVAFQTVDDILEAAITRATTEGGK